MKKLMWTGFYIEMIMLLVMLILAVLQRQIPDLVQFIFVIGMLICIISSFFAARENTIGK